MSVYDVNGNEVIGSGGALDVTELALYNDGNEVVRQGMLTYNRKKLYPINHREQRKDKVKKYDGGLMLAIGDSYTSIRASAFNKFAADHGVVCDNLGLASSTIAGSADGVTVGYHAFWVRLDNEIASFPKTIGNTTYNLSDVKLVTFMGGANDWYTVSEQVDRLGDPTSTDKEQLYGACKYIFERLHTVFPQADVIVILQPSNVAQTINNYAMWLKEGIVRECAEMYSIPICDCCFDWHSPVNPDELSAYWQSDHLHLNDAGYAELFKRLEKTLNNLQFYKADM